MHVTVLSAFAFGAFASAQTGVGNGQAQFAPIAGMELVPALQRAHDVGAADPSQLLDITVSLPYAHPAEMQAFVDSVSDPKSPNYRHFLSPEEIGEQFGAPRANVDAVANWLVENGMQVTLVSKSNLAVCATTTVAQAENAFHTTIRAYTLTPIDDVEPSQFIANSTPIQLPAAIASTVIDVFGLQTYTRPQHRTTLNPMLTRGLYDSANLFNANFKGQGRTTAISNFDGFRANNWLLYITHFSLPTPPGGAGSNITTVKISGGAGAGAAGGEGDLDIQMELGMVPLGNIIIYDGGQNNLLGTLTKEATDNLADTISESYGWSLAASAATSAHNEHLAMSAEGITYMAATGDSGTSLGSFDYPDYDPEVLQVGGTVATVNTSTGARISEVGWGGSGGGWSNKSISFNVRPSWQVGTGVPPITGSNNHRLLPDLAFHASSNNGAYQFYYNNALTGGFVGTSFASPICAGMLAIAESKAIALGFLPPDVHGHQRLGRVQDLIYSQNGNPAIWHDITVGNNGTLPDGSASTCHVGWDTVTGWGPFDVEAFATQSFGSSCPAPTVYCTAKLNSQFCSPSISFTGSPSATNAAAFNIKATQMLNNKNGLLFYGFTANGAPFEGGTLCVKLPITRTSVQNSGGTASGVDCTGAYSYNFNALIQGGTDANLVAGATVFAQYWARDPADFSGFTTSLSDALSFQICP